MGHLVHSSFGARQVWETAPPAVELLPSSVHIWRASFSATKIRPADLWASLSEDEKRRASQFHLPEDHDAYVISHGMLRDALARYRGVVRSPLRICYGPKGQPYLLQYSDGPRLHFSLSHSRSLALLAVTLGRKLGIDLEQQSAGAEWKALTSQYFSPLEAATLLALPASEQEHAFLSLWTHKEAYLKARGEGLSAPLDACAFRMSPDGTLGLDSQGDGATSASWSFLKLDPGEEHLAALAVQRDLGKLQFWDWRPLNVPGGVL